ncbi:pyridoxal phosphate-dependent aminotransferase [Gehongia tenuis]|uniref:Aminotransferase n=1 Tax=Gehongia tenuis TaxID=2763655 RepID=A0A926D414_9FIRM|nr:pyridoxal phosphate-dependent aminotransferase [Gehongia tenuis]MBC8531353.1 pyridoxal phosphate-dependent aminotransferase [Gehongia tenuis]
MISQKMVELGSKRSVIREIFEFGKKRAAEVGAENVFDFSLGNPSVPPPECVKETLLDLLQNGDPVLVHGYTSAQGDAKVRQQIAESLNSRFGTNFDAGNLYMTVGAAASLSVCFKALAVPGDEFIAFAPFFTEYRVFVEAAGGTLKVVPPNYEDFQIDFEKFEAMIGEHTKAVIINSPNNPSGAIYSEETIVRLCRILTEKSEALGHPIYLVTDEPYREIVYDGGKVPFLTKYYKNTLVCYSYSKSLSLPGERIGYVLVPGEIVDFEKTYAAICGAGRALGYVCAPSLFQQMVARCEGKTSDISVYKKNRDLLYNGLTEFGYTCVKPDGAFYLFVKAMEEDANAFCERAKKFDLLLVPGDDFGCPGYVRIAYCVKTEQIERSMPAFQKLAETYK